MDIRLEPEQIDVLCALVEAHRQVAREKRDHFLVLNTSGGTQLIHSGLRDWSLEVAHSDLEVLVDARLLRPRFGDRGLLASVAVLPQALDYCDALQRHQADAFTPGENSPFAEAEVRSIKDAVDQVREQLGGAALSPSARANIDAKLDYILEASRRLGRFDWRVVTFTMLWDVAIQAAFNPAQARSIIDFVLGAVRGALPA